MIVDGRAKYVRNHTKITVVAVYPANELSSIEFLENFSKTMYPVDTMDDVIEHIIHAVSTADRSWSDVFVEGVGPVKSVDSADSFASNKQLDENVTYYQIVDRLVHV